MTFTLTRAFYIPAAELNAVERREGDVVTYTWEKDGSILARGFSGRSNKPDFFHRYSTIEARTAAIDRFFESNKQLAAAKAARKAAEKAAKDALNATVDFPVGTILVYSGGWEQTNVRFHKVVGHFGRLGIKVVAIGSKRDETRNTGNGMADYCLPNPEQLCDNKVLNCRISDKRWAKVDGDIAQVWDGQPEYRSWYA